MKELNQISIFEQLTSKTMSQKQASQLLNLLRQVKRKLKAYRRLGASALVHKLRGKPSNHHLPGLSTNTILSKNFLFWL